MQELKQFLSFIEQNDLFNKKDSVLLAVSGGRDSVLMAHLFKAAGFEFALAHCNFCLRGDESDADEQFVTELAEELDVPFYSTSFNTESYAKEHQISIQMAARDLRYTWLEEIRSQLKFSYIAIAQHQNDIVETVLLNQVRGTGISGMHGILAKRDKIIRPLLFLTRDDIDEIMRRENFSFREDSSNQSAKYARNKIRLEVIPALKELNPQLEETFMANTKRFAELEILLNNKICEVKENLFELIAEDEFQISINKLKDLVPLNTLLFGLFQPYGFNEAILEDLRQSWNKPGKIFKSATHQILTDRDFIFLSKIGLANEQQIQVPENGKVIWHEIVYNSFVTEVENFELRSDSNLLQADYSLLQFPLRIRNWRKGDYFYPLGMKGKKKLSDFFIEQKIPLSKKNEVGVLENNNGDIIWICGYRLDERYKVKNTGKKIFILERQ
ncbi:MAG: tRNA lysidine(34) synthetase TilS [Daejeonella sp.]